MLTPTEPPKTLSDLPAELVTGCHDALLEILRHDPDWDGYVQLVETNSFGRMHLICSMLRNFGVNMALRALIWDLLATSPSKQKAIKEELLESMVDAGHVMNFHGRHITDDYHFPSILYEIDRLFTLSNTLRDNALVHFLANITLSLSFESNGRIYLHLQGGTMQLLENRTNSFPLSSLQHSAAQMLPLLAMVTKLVLTVASIGQKSAHVPNYNSSADIQSDMVAVSRMAFLGPIFPHLEQLIAVLRPSDAHVQAEAADANLVPVMARAVQVLRALPIHHKFVAFLEAPWDTMEEHGVDVDAVVGREEGNMEIAAAVIAAGGQAVRVP